MADTILFYAFAFLTLAGAIATITRRSAVHCAISLVVSLLGVAGIFLLLGAEFLFAVQIILYIGGIVVLFLFVIMLVNLDEAARQRQFQRQWPLAALTAVLAGFVLLAFLRRGSAGFTLPQGASPKASTGNVERIADLLFTEYLLPFELASILLLVAIVGSVLLSRRRAQ